MNLLVVFCIGIFNLTSAFAYEPPNGPLEFTCANQDQESHVSQVLLYRSGSAVNDYYKAEVLFLPPQTSSNFVKKVYLGKIYDGRVLVFASSTFRVKIDTVQKDQYGRYKAFVRIPSHGISSNDWVCKGAEQR